MARCVNTMKETFIGDGPGSRYETHTLRVSNITSHIRRQKGTHTWVLRLRLHAENKKTRGATPSRLDCATHRASVSDEKWEKKGTPREKKCSIGVALGVAHCQGFEAGHS
jgi:hypothetical protein